MEKAPFKTDHWSVKVDVGPGMEWVAEMRWPEGETQGGPEMLVLYPSDPTACPPGGLSQTVLRDIDFKQALERLRAGLARSKHRERSRKRTSDTLTTRLREYAHSGAITPEYLALLSRVYVDSVNNGQDKPLEHLAVLTEKSSAAIKNHLWQATRTGLLERSPGRAGGRVTDKGREILAPVVALQLEEGW